MADEVDTGKASNFGADGDRFRSYGEPFSFDRKPTMRRAIFLILPLFLLATQSPALARDLQIVSVDPGEDEGSIVMIDRDTLKLFGTYTRVWKYTLVKEKGGNTVRAAGLLEVDCLQEKSHDLTRKYYNVLGDFEGTSPAVDPWDFNSPGSIGYSVVERVCGKVTFEEEMHLGDRDPIGAMNQFLVMILTPPSK